LTDKDAQIIEQYQYSPYGLLLSGDASKTPFLFNGMYGVMTDSNGLYYMRARFYNPEIKRFINQDILLGGISEGQTLNRYAFVTGQPVSFVDPFGLAKCCEENDYDCLFNGGSLCPIEITVINDNAGLAGFLATLFRIGEIYMDDTASMVDNVLNEAGYRPISRLNILDHAYLYPNGVVEIYLGKDHMNRISVLAYISLLSELKGKFTNDGFIHLHHCNLGKDWKFLQKLAAIFGVPVYANDGLTNAAFGFSLGDYIKVEPDGTVILDVDIP